jgi:hypothetical protein
MNMDMEALQTILGCCDNYEHLGGDLYRFSFEGLIDVEVDAQRTDKGWRVLYVRNSEREYI